MVIEQPLTNAFSLLFNLARVILLVILLTLVVFMILAMVVSKQLTEPIRVLVGKIQQMTKGNQLYAHAQSSDEVKSLTNAFDALLDELNFLMQEVLQKSGQVAYVEDINRSMSRFLDQIPGGIITLDHQGSITSVNPAALDILECNQCELVGANVHQDHEGPLDYFFSRLSDRVKQPGRHIEEICKIQGTKGDWIPVVLNTLRQTDMNDTLIGLTVVIQNQDMKRQFEDSVNRTKRLTELGAFSTGVAHEIRNPLAAIRGYAQLAQRNVKDNPQAYDDIQVILTEVDRLDAIIERFMTFAKPSLPQKTWSRMDTLVQDVTNLLQAQADQQGVTIEVDLPVMDQVFLDFDQMKQVLINLYVNAMQAMPRGGHIRVVGHLDPETQTLHMTVSDTGEGVSRKNQEQIFEPFFTTRNEGTGLGLAICARIIENHKGTITLTSDGVMGTTMALSIPLEVQS